MGYLSIYSKYYTRSLKKKKRKKERESIEILLFLENPEPKHIYCFIIRSFFSIAGKAIFRHYTTARIYVITGARIRRSVNISQHFYILVICHGKQWENRFELSHNSGNHKEKYFLALPLLTTVIKLSCGYL